MPICGSVKEGFLEEVQVVERVLDKRWGRKNILVEGSNETFQVGSGHEFGQNSEQPEKSNGEIRGESIQS